MKMNAVLLAAAVAFVPSSASTVSVAYAGSLVATMEGPVAHALLERTGIHFSGEAKGSRALANLIRAGLRHPDVFISADPALLKGLAPTYVVFGSARMVIAYSDKSPQASLFAAAGKGNASLLALLTAPGVRVGRTDPQLDPKGARTIRAIGLLGKHEGRAALANTLLANAQVFPEEDLAVRVETGELDAAFFYSTETGPLKLHTIELPGAANLSDEITYAVAVLPHAAHPAAAAAFMNFLLNGDGKTVLEAAGVRYFAHPRVFKGKQSA
ncbi:MAG TPA: substrate-binding domain-containing protein [Candidatus Rubrimentiphilum sp.]|nr:substrate-binding domain-containing protein [Candidatus Rubrimentiphilum sp.]